MLSSKSKLQEKSPAGKHRALRCLGQEDGKLSWVFLNSQRVYLPRGEGGPFVVGAQW